jgi:hypothetical protein
MVAPVSAVNDSVATHLADGGGVQRYAGADPVAQPQARPSSLALVDVKASIPIEEGEPRRLASLRGEPRQFRFGRTAQIEAVPHGVCEFKEFRPEPPAAVRLVLAQQARLLEGRKHAMGGAARQTGCLRDRCGADRPRRSRDDIEQAERANQGLGALHDGLNAVLTRFFRDHPGAVGIQ